MPVRSPYPDVEIPDASLTAFLFGNFGDRADAPAFVDGASGRAITFGAIADMVDKIAAALGERGIGAGDVVGLFAPNSPEWAAVFHGVLRANAVVTSANSLYTPGELAHQLADSGAKLLVTASPFLDRARAALAEAGLPDDAVVTLDAVEGVTSLADLLATAAGRYRMTTSDDDRAAAAGAQRRGLRDVTRRDGHVSFIAADPQAVEELSLALAADGIALRSLVPVSATLEELFFAITEGDGLADASAPPAERPTLEVA